MVSMERSVRMRRVWPGARAPMLIRPSVLLGALFLRGLGPCALGLCAVGFSQGEQAGVEQAVSSDPAGVESYVEARAPWLGTLRAWLGAEGTAAALGDGVAFSAPPKDKDEWIERSDTLLVVRSYGESPEPLPAQAFRERLIRGSVAPGDVRISSKVVGARMGEGGGRILTVWLEASGQPEFGLPPVWQLTATLEVEFAAVPDAAHDSAHGTTCLSVALLSFERAQIDKPTFAEKTAATFLRDPEAAALLGVGMDRWASRLDDPALSAFFGHQGLAAGDVTGDGLDDLYVAMPAGVPNLLLVQDGEGGVRDMASEKGVAWLDDTKGVLIIDMDKDGDLDLVSAVGHVIAVQINDGEGPFRMGGVGAAPDQASFYSLAAADVTGDGVPEIFGTRYVTTRYADAIPIPFEEAQNGPTNHLFQLVDGQLEDITERAFPGGAGTQFSLSAAFFDADGDFYTDLYVVNDFGSNRLFKGSRAGVFEDVTESSGLADPGAGMGATFGDFDGDGSQDVYVTNMYSSAGRRVAWQPEFAPGRKRDDVLAVRRLAAGNSLLRGNGKGRFTPVEGFHAEMGRWGWGGVFTDFDGDGFPDLLVPAGFLTGPKPGDL